MAQQTPSTICIAAVLAILFAVAADARFHRDLPVTEPTPTNGDRFPDDDPILLLPSDDQLVAGESSENSPAAKEEDEKKTAEEAPVTVVGFRPINRHFAIPPVSRRPHLRRGCRHGHTIRGLRPWTPRYGRIRYGNEDVLAAAAAGKDLSGGRPVGDSADLPLRWGQPGYKYERPAVIDLSDEVIVTGDGEHLQENLILNKIRKFLKQF
ncbi:unnamed protein product [Linum trigynum]|uniref:Uncharacterized protein n=1 Tax=Linum trigynum TaxID=586398 RepID=A0AAV2ELH3_9ROSI